MRTHQTITRAPRPVLPVPADGWLIKLISAVAGSLLFLLASGAFVLSYAALRQVALDFGLPPTLSYIWPILLDAAMVIFSLAVLRGSLQGEETIYAWILTGLFAFLTLGGNVYHAPESFLASLLPKSVMSPIVWAIPPVALLLAFELLMQQVKQEVKRHSAIVTLAELTGVAEARRQEIVNLEQQQAKITAERDRLTGQVDQLTGQVEALKAEIVQLRQEKEGQKVSNLGNLDEANTARYLKKEQAMNALLDYLADHPQASLAEAGQSVGRSKATAGNYINELTQSGRLLRRNGQGWIVSRIGD